jgi:hypothetical protein
MPAGIAGAPIPIPPHQYLGNVNDIQALGLSVGHGPDARGMLAQFELGGSGVPNLNVDKTWDENIQVGNLQSNIFQVNKLGVNPKGYEEGDTWRESLMYAACGTEGQTMRKDLVYTVKSQATLNAFLRSEDGRRLTANVTKGEELQSIGRFVGPLEVGPAGWQNDGGRTTNFITVIPGGRARIKEITRAQAAASTNERQQGSVPNEFDSMWLLRTKCHEKSTLKCALDDTEAEMERRLGKKIKLNDGSGASIEYDNHQGTPETYWNDFAITTLYRTKPAMWMYSSRGDGLDPRSRFTGMCTYVGKIQSTEGKRVENESMTHHARTAQMGKDGWKMSLNALRNMEVMISVS